MSGNGQEFEYGLTVELTSCDSVISVASLSSSSWSSLVLSVSSFFYWFACCPSNLPVLTERLVGLGHRLFNCSTANRYCCLVIKNPLAISLERSPVRIVNSYFDYFVEVASIKSTKPSEISCEIAQLMKWFSIICRWLTNAHSVWEKLYWNRFSVFRF